MHVARCHLIGRPFMTYASQPQLLKYLELLESIVNLNSGTGNSSGCDRVRELLIPHFEKLGYQTTLHTVHPDHKVLVFDFPESKPELMLVGHLDTVFPPDSHFQKFEDLGDRVTGPGVIDMKGGVVLLLNLLSDFHSDLNLKSILRKIRIVLNDEEEIGSPHSKELLKKLGKESPYGLVFEPGLPDRSIVTSEAGVFWFELHVKGAAAHAGLEHHKGVNAGLELAHKLTQLSTLTDYSRNLTVNIGTLKGGTRTNVVCDHAVASIEVRYAQEKDLTHVQKELGKIVSTMTVSSAETGEKPRAEIKPLAQAPCFTARSSEKLLPFFHKAEQQTHQSIPCKHVGYSSDANHLAQTGMSLLVGLGPYGGGMHTHHEFMLKSAYLERLELGKALIRALWEV